MAKSPEETLEWLREHGRWDCDSPYCTRMGYGIEGAPKYGVCIGMHCAYCDGPCSLMGHKDCMEKAKAERGQ